MSERFYLEVDFSSGQQQTLTGPEAHHLINVMRAKPGDKIQVFDGRGTQANATIESTNRRDVRIQLQDCQTIDLRPNTRILVAATIPKGDRLRFLIEKLTELGACAWLPLQTKRSVNPLNPNTQKKIRQWTIDACKQSLRNHLLLCLPPADLDQVLQQHQSIPSKWIAAAPKDERETMPEDCLPFATTSSVSEPHVQGASSSEYDQILLVGPEGGFTEDEVHSAVGAGFHPKQIGNLVLRIETAAIALMTTVLFGDGKS